MTVLRYPTSSTAKHLKIQDCTCGKAYEAEGIFAARFKMTLRQRSILRDLSDFYTKANIESVLLPVLDQRNCVSLRAVDWLVTNFAKKNNVVITVKARLFNIHHEYKTSLSYFRRRNFDPFRRRMRITFVHDGTTHETTIGQLNFIRWAHENKIMEYAFSNISEIEEDMHSVSQLQRQAKRDCEGQTAPFRRRELSIAPSRKVAIYKVTQKVTF